MASAKQTTINKHRIPDRAVINNINYLSIKYDKIKQ